MRRERSTVNRGLQDKPPFIVSGSVALRFEPVRNAFAANFERRREAGAAVAVYHRGELVVDLVAGVRDPVSNEPYSCDALQPIFSATKAITALAANMLADRGQLDLDRPVVKENPV